MLLDEVVSSFEEFASDFIVSPVMQDLWLKFLGDVLVRQLFLVRGFFMRAENTLLDSSLLESIISNTYSNKNAWNGIIYTGIAIE